MLSERPDTRDLDTAVVDINLGNGLSFDAARALQEQHVPLLLVTGYDQGILPDDLSHVERLEKPFRERELISALQRITQHPA